MRMVMETTRNRMNTARSAMPIFGWVRRCLVISGSTASDCEALPETSSAGFWAVLLVTAITTTFSITGLTSILEWSSRLP